MKLIRRIFYILIIILFFIELLFEGMQLLLIALLGTDSLLDVPFTAFLKDISVYSICIGIFAFGFYVIKKRFTKLLIKKISLFALIAMVLLNMVFIAKLSWEFYLSQYSQTVWANELERRSNMVYDMYDKIKIDSLNKNQIKAILGKEYKGDLSSYQRSVDSYNDTEIDIYFRNSLVYYLGGTGEELPGYYLYLKFDKQDKLIRKSVFVLGT